MIVSSILSDHAEALKKEAPRSRHHFGRSHELRERQLAVHQVELDCSAEFAERIRNLPQIGGAA